jgi:hypothetical protein
MNDDDYIHISLKFVRSRVLDSDWLVHVSGFPGCVLAHYFIQHFSRCLSGSAVYVPSIANFFLNVKDIPLYLGPVSFQQLMSVERTKVSALLPPYPLPHMAHLRS